MLGLFHTGAAHVQAFEALVQAAEPGLATRHVVREDLLARAAAAGNVTDELVGAVQAEIQSLVAHGARVVLCTCSTLGSAAEATPTNGGATVLRVDRPLAEQVIDSGRRILVVTATPSAQRAALDLLRAVATERQAPLQLAELSCNSAWPQFLAGDHAGYARQVAELIETHALPGDQVMLAQASMAPALPLIGRRDIDVSVSPSIGVRAALAAYRAQSRA